MAQPPAYDRQYDFIDFQASNPADPLPANQIAIEYNAIKTTLDAILNNLDLIQRDDGALANESVGNDQLEVSLRTGINPPTVWSSSTAYSVNDTVVFSNASRSELWLALEAHTSSADFDTDTAAGKWRQLADWSTLNLDAAQTAYDNTSSGLDAEDVQAAIDELVDDIAAVGGGGVSDGDKGDITVSGSGATWTIDSGVIDAGKLATDAVETAKIQNAAVTTAKIGASAVVTAKLANSAVTADKINDGAVTADKINDGAVATAKLATDAVTLAKMEHGTSGDILYYGATGTPTRLAKGADGEALKLVSGFPAWGSGAGAITVKTFTVDGTWNKPAGLVSAEIWVVGGGGGGGGVNSTDTGAGGGGGGGAAYTKVDAASLGSSETVTIGAGGSGAGTGATTAGGGGSSSFGAHASATGGSGAGGESAASGGVGSDGDVNLSGQGGGPGSSAEAQGGAGGSAAGAYGGGGAPGVVGSTEGAAGGNYGGGGGGGGNAGSNPGGGDGADGIVVVIEHF